MIEGWMGDGRGKGGYFFKRLWGRIVAVRVFYEKNGRRVELLIKLH